MGNRIENRVILSTLRYKSAPSTNLMFNVPLIQTSKQNVEFDRSINIDLPEIYNTERQRSTNFRPTCKFTILFKNSYSGKTNYEPYENNLYYLDIENAAANDCPPNSNFYWGGLPQYNEFDFIRTDYNVTGYTQPPNQHLIFKPKSASTYNWTYYMSYAFENNFQKQLNIYDIKTQQVKTWISGDGIPFIIENGTNNGLGIVTFRCLVKHGLTEGEFVKLNFSYNGNDTFQVYSLGNDFFGSDENYFSILNVGYTGTTFNDGTYGTFKRIILTDNTGDTISKYYVRRHKIITKLENTVLSKAGFEENIFGISKKYESRIYTPNKNARISIKEGAQSYSLSFNQDIDINELRDNQKRPISELFFTVIWKGYFGWTLGAAKQGWDFNIPPKANGTPTNWWNTSLSNTNFQIDSYTNLGYTFKYTKDLTSGDTLDGDYCEWNDYEQKERIISSINHKFLFNPANFNLSNFSSFGYYYKPHYMIKIRDFSDYIEEGDVQNVVGVPDYAYFSSERNKFIWRDLYPYGYVDNDGIGVDYPFLNNTHYPYQNYMFRIIPEGTNYIEYNITQQPTIDNCE